MYRWPALTALALACADAHAAPCTLTGLQQIAPTDAPTDAPHITGELRPLCVRYQPDERVQDPLSGNGPHVGRQVLRLSHDADGSHYEQVLAPDANGCTTVCVIPGLWWVMLGEGRCGVSTLAKVPPIAPQRVPTVFVRRPATGCGALQPALTQTPIPHAHGATALTGVRAQRAGGTRHPLP